LTNLAESLAHKNPVYAWDTKRWVERQVSKARKLGSVLEKEYIRKVKKTGHDRDANIWLRKTVDSICRSDLNLAAYDDEIQRFCDIKALQCERIIYRHGLEPVRELMSVYGLKFPKDKSGKECPKRAACKKWWRRQVRALAHRECEHICRKTGIVSKRQQKYVSDFTFNRWLESQQRNQSLMLALEAENDQGQKYTLAELSDLGQSNPVNRRNELMVRMRGFEEWAERDARKWIPLFLTVTTPSKYHSTHSKGFKNASYQGSTPRQAQAYLTKLWAQIRAELARDEVEYFGFRVAEPHHDGTPHWHMLLFVLADHAELLADTVREYALREDGWEPGAKEYRFECVEITADKGTPTGYIAKYVAKNIDGFMVGVDLETNAPAVEMSARVKAWASVWGIRQFQQIGGPPVTVYRELRRLANHPEQLPLIGSEEIDFSSLLLAADTADWSEFVEKMGGAVCRRDARPLRIWYRQKEQLGRYAEALKEIKGLWSWWFVFPLKSRVREWKVGFKERVGEIAHSLRAPPRALDLCQ